MSNQDISSNHGCSCQYIIALTKADSIINLEKELGNQLKQLLGSINFILYKANDKLCLISTAKIRTNFELSEQPNSIIRLVVEDNLESELTEQIESLLEVYQNQLSLITQINHDQLTKLGNRLALDSKFDDLFAFQSSERRKQHQDTCVAIIDIDHFKSINDEFGHLYGDEVLTHISRLMVKTFRDSDILFRYGGEEFVVILADLKLRQATNVMERFRQSVENFDFPFVNKVTVSLGLTQLDVSTDKSTTIERADKALYFSKQQGRNQLNSFENLVQLGKINATTSAANDLTLFV